MTTSSPNTRIDARVVSAIDLSTKAYIPRWTSLEWSEQLNDVGNGTIRMDFKDPFFSTFNTQYGDGALFNGTYAIQVLREGTLVFTFMIEDTDVQRTGYAQEIVMAGRGIGAQLEWATVLPEGYHAGMNIVQDTGGTDVTYDREILSYEYLAQAATTTNLSAVYTFTQATTGKLTASANGSINDLSIDGVTDLVVGSIVLVKNQTDAKQNGIYYVSVVGNAGTKWVLEYDADFYFNENFCYVGGNTYVQYGTTQKEKVFTITACPTSEAGFSSTNITFAEATDVYTAISLFYALFREADEGVEIVTTKGPTWGNQNTGYGRGGSTKAVDWALTLDASLTANKGKRDSKGKLPKDGGLTNLGRGQTLLQTLQTAAEQTECDWYISPTGVISIARKPTVTNPSPIGTDRTTGATAMLLPLPLAASSQTKSTTRETRTVVYGTNSALIDVAESSEAIAIAGRRESYIENTGDDTKSATNIATTGLAKIAGAKLGIDIQFIEVDGRQAWLDFSVGDKVLVEYEIGVFAERIISGISGSVDSSFTVDIQLTLDEIIPDAVTSLQNQSIYGTSQAAILRASLNNNRGSIPAPTLGVEPQSTVSGMSNAVSLSFSAPSYGRATSYEAHVYQTTGMHRISGTSRSSGVATLTTADAHDYQVGDRVTVTGTTTYDTTDAPITAVNLTNKTFSYENVGDDGSGFVTGNYIADGSIVITAISKVNGICTVTTSRNHGFVPGQHIIVSDSGSTELDGFDKSIISCPSTTQFTYSTSGINATSSTGRVRLIAEMHTVRSAVGDNTASVQNLATSDRPYYVQTASINSDGVAGLPSNPTTFFSSDNAMEVVGGAIKSPNYVGGTLGWIVHSDGSAEFSDVTVRGTIDSSVITGGQIDIGGTDSSSFHVNSAGDMWSGSGTLITTGTPSGRSPFYVKSNGDLFARNATISGEVNASSGTFSGTITATGTISGGTISGGSIVGSSFANGTTFAVSTSGGLKIDNILAGPSSIGGSPGIRILANGASANDLSASSGSIYLYAELSNSIRLGFTNSNESARKFMAVTLATGLTSGSAGANGLTPTGNAIRITTPDADDGGSGTTGIALGWDRTPSQSATDGKRFKNVGIGGLPHNVRTLQVHGDILLNGDGNGDFFTTSISSVSSGTNDRAAYLSDTAGLTFLAEGASLRILKDNIADIENAEETIKSLRPRKYTWKPGPNDDEYSGLLKQLDTRFGFIAEEVQEAQPYLASYKQTKEFRDKYPNITDEDINNLPLQYYRKDDIVAISIQALKNLIIRVEYLESQLSN